MLKKYVSVEQLRLMPTRILFSLETNATRKLENLLLQLKVVNNSKPMKILIVGAGGSFPSALVVKQILADECRTSEIEVATPQTAIRKLRPFPDTISKPCYNVVIAISYSGKTPDIQKVYEVCRCENVQFILVTKAKLLDVQEMYTNFNLISNNIVSYYNENDDTGNERGMISMTSTLAPIAIFDSLCSDFKADLKSCFDKGNEFVESLDIAAIAKSVQKVPIINVFYELETMPTAFDIESKFTEAGIANIVLHEKKNFSHGRYVSLYTLKSGLNINLTKSSLVDSIYSKAICKNHVASEESYDEKLDTFLKNISTRNETAYIKIGTNSSMSHQWNIEAMSIIPYLLVAIGEAQEIDVSKPLQPFPEEAKELYNYRGEF